MSKRIVTQEELNAAYDRYDEAAHNEPRAKRVSYDEKRGMLVIEFRAGAILWLPVAAIPGLRDATPNQLKGVYTGFDGESISIDELDFDIGIPGLMRDMVDLTSAAAVLGRKGGSSKSAAKAQAVRENGKLGGRPRKVPTSLK